MTPAPFSTAEASLLLSPSKSDGKEMLMYTFMELLLNGVFTVAFEMHRPHAKERESIHTFLYRGENFYVFRPRAHQEIFIDAFPDEVQKIQFRPFARNVFTSVETFNEYKKLYIYQAMLYEGYFLKNDLMARFNVYFLSQKGKELQSVYKKRLAEVNANFLSWIKADLDKAVLSVVELGASIMLMKDFNFKMLDILNIYIKNRRSMAMLYNTDFAKIESEKMLKFNDLWDELDTSLDWFHSGGLVGDLPGGI